MCWGIAEKKTSKMALGFLMLGNVTFAGSSIRKNAIKKAMAHEELLANLVYGDHATFRSDAS
ncbi:hypothetical protein [Symbiopectobacterium sp. RP]|uniref:hypothetical protein n=1 Tax=Symbiopectobacterium sp. RP TaxID=3248553 RepID=UPI003D269274